MDIKYNTLFFIDKEGNKERGYKPDGKVRMRIRYSEGKVDFNVGYRVEIEKWNIETQRCRVGTTHGKKKIPASEINKEIQRLESLVQEVFKTFEVAETTPPLQLFREAFNTANGKAINPAINKDISLFTQFDEFTKEVGILNNWTNSTYEKFASIKNHLYEFDKKISYDKLDEKKLTAYVDFLQNTKNMRNSTISKNLSFVRWFLRWTFKKKYNTNDAFEYFRPKLKTAEKKIIFLDWDEVMQLKEFKIPPTKQYLERVRDVFLFQCFTSLRYSDVRNLRRSDIKNNAIEIVTIKDTDSIIIELNKFSRPILDKYKDIHFENDLALPVISNQKMNEYLKELGELAGIDESIREVYFKGNERIEKVYPKYKVLGTHAGRRTFICISLELGIPPQTVMKWTGHSDYKAMKPYIDTSNKAKKQAMNRWNELTEEKEKEGLLEQLKNLPKEEL